MLSAPLNPLTGKGSMPKTSLTCSKRGSTDLLLHEYTSRPSSDS